MSTHRFDPISAALGFVAVAAGLIVITGSWDRLDADGGWWFALAALALSAAIVASAVRQLRSDDITTVSEAEPGKW